MVHVQLFARAAGALHVEPELQRHADREAGQGDGAHQPLARGFDREQVEIDRRRHRRVDDDEAEVGDPRPGEGEGEQRRHKAEHDEGEAGDDEHAHVPAEAALPGEDLREQGPEATPQRRHHEDAENRGADRAAQAVGIVVDVGVDEDEGDRRDRQARRRQRAELARHHRRERLLGRQRVAGQAQAQGGATDMQVEVAPGVGEGLRGAAGDALAADAEAVLRRARADDQRRGGAAIRRRHEIDRRVLRGDVRIGQHDVVVEGAADRHRPALDAPGLPHHAVAVERLEQRRPGRRRRVGRRRVVRLGDDAN